MRTQTLIIGDARRLPELADASIHLVVTSPPYWQLKDYGRAGQIGFDQSLEAYHDALEEVWAECLRVLHPGCRLCINVGDQFARKEIYGRYKVIPLHAEITRRVEGRGADFMGSIIWQKVTTCNTSGGGSLMGSYPYPRNGVVKLDYEHILLFKKPGKGPTPSAESKARSKLSLEEWKTWFHGHWTFPGTRADQHLAPFPVELPRRLIRMFTFEGDRVLDPFVGSGTTLVAAEETEREGIGVELDASLEALVRERLEGAPGELPFHQAPRLEVKVRDAAPAAVPEGDRPFFGSIVSRDDRKRTRHVGVRDRLQSVDGPNRFTTRGGRVIELLGTVPRAGHVAQAQARLSELLEGRAFLLTDQSRAPLPDDETRAYVHLLDRTFVNSRLVREGLLLADRKDPDHPHRAKFLREEDGASES